MVRSLLLVLLAAGQLFGQADKSLSSQLPSWVRVEANYSYSRYPETVVDIMRPARKGLAKRPGVLVIHGGGWVGGTKEGMIKNYCLPFLEEGFVVANVEYRLAKAATAPAAVSDVLEAASWFRRNADQFDLDPERIIVTGNSAGGHLALMVGMAPASAELGPPATVRAVVNFYGITDVADQLSGPNRRNYAVTWLPEQDGRLEL
ncbi:MAG: alpha/beta hydrolase, partial [bacterium]|nr:alpha/beta hydrolase [bacterium]